ncbi:MAG: type I-F CRISPR-associated endoribonuclease Cas6/Csy4 [Methylococcaceae bacterium]
MKCYLDITLLPGADIDHHFLWEKVYQQIHLGFVEMQGADDKVPIGIALPEYDVNNYQLGSKLRLLAKDSATLESFNAKYWLKRLSDYVHITSIRDVPEKITTYACFHRIQPKSSNARLARRKAKRENLTVDQALTILEKYQEQQTKAPYIHIKSQSNGEKFCLFIGFIENKLGNIDTGFSTYGLSRQSTVPIF